MIGIDANVLIRYLTKDDAKAFEVARDFLKQRSPADPAYVSTVAFAETIWVLRRSYGFSIAKLSEVVTLLMRTTSLVIEGSDTLKTSNGIVRPDMIADYLVAYLSIGAGCRTVVTFDKRAAKNVPGMELLT